VVANRPKIMLVARGMSICACRLFSRSRGIKPAIVVTINRQFGFP